jgi:hypothetical protein
MESLFKDSMRDFAQPLKPRRKLRLTSLFFTIGLLLMCFNLFIDVTHYFTQVQPHTLGGAITAFAGSILSQLTES